MWPCHVNHAAAIWSGHVKTTLAACILGGGRGKNRTLMTLRSLAPEASASTSSATRPLFRCNGCERTGKQERDQSPSVIPTEDAPLVLCQREGLSRPSGGTPFVHRAVPLFEKIMRWMCYFDKASA